MRVINLNGATGSCRIIIGDSIENLRSHLENKRIIVITGKNVRRLHGDKF